ncbi:MAG TPA: hypothetical protein VLL52_22345 [Anaerolineae bacterium]|nr:hypothetical protein [Anaerolineae bacterium]
MAKNNRLPKRARLRGGAYTRMLNLLDMAYPVSHLATLLDLSEEVFVNVYIPRGLPVVIKANQHVWIYGHAFRDWYLVAQKQGKQTLPLAEDEVYCPTCKGVIKMVNPERRIKNKALFWLCTCAVCGKQAAKFIGPWRGE